MNSKNDMLLALIKNKHKMEKCTEKLDTMYNQS